MSTQTKDRTFWMAWFYYLVGIIVGVLLNGLHGWAIVVPIIIGSLAFRLRPWIVSKTKDA